MIIFVNEDTKTSMLSCDPLEERNIGIKTLKCTYLLKYNPIRAGPCQ